MRCWPAATLLLVPLVAAGCGARSPAIPRATAHPMRVLSINLCTDQLVLALLPPARIASVSWLARDPALSVMARQAAAVGVNHGETEEVAAQAPDLVVADTFGKPVLRAMLKRLGYPLIEVEQPTDLDGIRRATRQVAAAVDARARGEALIKAMDSDLAELARHPGPSTTAAAWGRDGIGARPGTLADTVLTAAGARNVARTPGGGADVEALLASNPALLVEADGGERRAASLGDAVLRHPLVDRYWHRRTLFTGGAYTTCGTPMIADAALRLRGRLREAAMPTGPLPPMHEATP